MRTVVLVLGVLGMLFGGYAFATAQSTNSALHEIESLIAFLIGTCGLGFAGLINEVETNTRAILRAGIQRSSAPPAPSASPSKD